jgi:hypothetical protein
MNNPTRFGSVARRCELKLSSRSRHGGGNDEVGLDLLPWGLDPESPVVGGLICRRRVVLQVVSSTSPGQGGWDWKRWPQLLFVGVVALLLLTLLPAGRGGEGYGVRRGVAATGGCPRLFPSNGRGVVEMWSLIAPAWCRGTPGSDVEAPPPNKLKAGWILGLGLESLATSSPSLH